MGKTFSKGYFCDLIKNDDKDQVAKVLEKHPEYISDTINDSKDTQALIIATCFGSNEVIKLFLEVKNFLKII